MDSMGDGTNPSMPLNASGVDFSNQTQAYDFLQGLLDDTVFQPVGTDAARKFWYGVVAVVGVAALCNITWKATLRARLRASRANHMRPSQPTNPLSKTLATLTALARESSYLQLTPIRYSFCVKIPPLGTAYLIFAYFAFLLVLQFVNNDVAGAQHYAALSIRAAWLAIAQLPLIILLVGKNNLVGLLLGVSYERLHVYHRWVARGMLLMATLHFGFESYGWNQYGLMSLEWTTDTCPPTGISAYALLLALNLLTLAPLRNWSYNLVVALHILFFIGFIVAITYHLIGQTSPTTVYYSTVFLYVSIALYLVERLTRTARYIYNNIRPGYATFEALEGGATRLRIRSRQIKRWSAGSHVRLSIPRYGVFPSHPATIVSTPTSHDGDLVFILQACEGFTKRIFTAASKDSLHGNGEEDQAGSASKNTRLALIDGPYGSHADFACFDTLLLIAGASGVTFTLSVLLSLAQRARASSPDQRLPVRAIHFIWIIKKRACISWIDDELRYVANALQHARIEFSIRIFVTCDDFVSEPPGPIPGPRTGGCQCREECSCCEDSPDAITVASRETDTAMELKQMDVHITREIHDLGIDGWLPSGQLRVGRPNFDALLWDEFCLAEGESAVAVCGPLSLSTSVRNTVVAISDERAVHKGTGAQGIYLHVENFH